MTYSINYQTMEKMDTSLEYQDIIEELDRILTDKAPEKNQLLSKIKTFKENIDKRLDLLV